MHALRRLGSMRGLFGARSYSSKIQTMQVGGPVGAPAHRLYFARNGSPVSPWHDIPLMANSSTNEYNMVVEIPRWTNAKLEINTLAPFNPITHDTKNGQLRYVANVFPYKGYIWNYGALPQTYEDPHEVDAHTQCVGDGDPIDVLEVGQSVCAEGSVHKVKVLGALALIDGEETDWKVLAIRSDDPQSQVINTVGDLEVHMPGLVAATVDWFTKYKVPDGKPPNTWAFDAKPKDDVYARDVIRTAHASWKKLVQTAHSDLALSNASVDESLHRMSKEDQGDAYNALFGRGSVPTAEPSEDANSKWHYIPSR
ncbi:Inorganic pyrophosphatase [Coemansia sp. RSA 2523]|nr:Inorganic pyrophosphatase [Coemansia sp. RSA 2167]KAJ1808042.1 Inorganic pyrophosphatase [Coemansia sp. RSA 2523]KAJ2154835.1 Inorganic pyrophosphatase [Coemansia sp. RSA 637]KAJ2537416.1 Inorganic pyrophosphatase [Coemansia sp. RSA 1935]